MNVHEYQAKEVLSAGGLPIPRGEVARTPEQAHEIAARIGGTVVVKAQVLTGGRGKAGGIKLATGPDEAELRARQILGMRIKGLSVDRVLVTEAADIEREIYLGAIVDRANHCVTLMASAEGGVEIEETARLSPEKIHQIRLDPLFGLHDYQARDLAFLLGLSGPRVREFTAIARELVAALIRVDGSLFEINPLVVTPADSRWQGRLLVLDAKLVLDDNALYRHPELEALRDTAAEDPIEARARTEGLSYVHLDGNIGCVVNGAGLAMATMDVVKLHGGAPANFLDVGGGARAERVAAALRIVLADPAVRVVLFNIFGGITRCDEVARGIVSALASEHVEVPIVVRLVGTNEMEGRQVLAASGLIAVTSMDEAAQAAVAALSATPTLANAASKGQPTTPATNRGEAHS